MFEISLWPPIRCINYAQCTIRCATTHILWGFVMAFPFCPRMPFRVYRYSIVNLAMYLRMRCVFVCLCVRMLVDQSSTDIYQCYKYICICQSKYASQVIRNVRRLLDPSSKYMLNYSKSRIRNCCVCDLGCDGSRYEIHPGDVRP